LKLKAAEVEYIVEEPNASSMRNNFLKEYVEKVMTAS